MRFVHFIDEKTNHLSEITELVNRKGKALNPGLADSKPHTYSTTKGLSLEVLLKVRSPLIRRKGGS